MDLELLLGRWPVRGPFTWRPVESGTNNLTWLVTGAGGEYVLRVYQNRHQVPAFEHRVLLALQEAGLPFAVPAPMRTHGGATVAETGGACGTGGAPALAALFPYIPGEAPDRSRPDHAFLVGQAWGQLDQALAGVDAGECPQPPYTDLYRGHPAVPDPLAVPALLGLEADEERRVAAIIERLVGEVDDLVARLPRQLIHADCACVNLLMDGGRITGVLDFEFVTYDLRVCDYAVGLKHFGWGRWGAGDEWPLLEAFSRGYASRLALSAAEIEVVPWALRLVRVGSLLHWTGRHLQGQAPLERARQQAAELLAMDRWLASHGGRLLERTALSAQPGAVAGEGA